MSKGTVAGKRSKKKPQVRICVTHSLSDGHNVSNSDNLKSQTSFGTACTDEDLLAESFENGVLYLNPQTPDWSLVERFAELSSEEEVEVPMKQVHSGSMSPCSIHTVTKGGLRKSPSANNSPKKRKDEKVPRLLAAMKRRSPLNIEERPFKCTRCHWAFKKFCNLQSHLQTHSGLKPHVCDICGKAYSHQGTLQQHKRLHTGERPYGCPFCDKTYIWSSDYRKHIRTHTGEKPYICETCGKDFIRSSDLRKHERNMHTNNKPFPCTHCGKTFNKPLSLKRHERKHLGERPFSCPDCGKTFCFTKSSNLTEHKAIHSGVRPHKCGECGVAFAMASRLVRHQFIHNNQKPHSCTGCSKNFSQFKPHSHRLPLCSLGASQWQPTAAQRDGLNAES
uniref:Zinc finger protein 648 n=1 Tax=Cyprinodon variegatus TaxID=28743 RepID=A0A3Q2E5E4_CYPVA